MCSHEASNVKFTRAEASGHTFLIKSAFGWGRRKILILDAALNTSVDFCPSLSTLKCINSRGRRHQYQDQCLQALISVSSSWLMQPAWAAPDSLESDKSFHGHQILPTLKRMEMSSDSGHVWSIWCTKFSALHVMQALFLVLHCKLHKMSALEQEERQYAKYGRTLAF